MHWGLTPLAIEKKYDKIYINDNSEKLFLTQATTENKGQSLEGRHDEVVGKSDVRPIEKQKKMHLKGISCLDLII